MSLFRVIVIRAHAHVCVNVHNLAAHMYSYLLSVLRTATGLWTWVQILVCCSYGVFLTLATTLAITLCEVRAMNYAAPCRGGQHAFAAPCIWLQY